MVKSKITDAVLINLYISGDENALGILVKRHQARVYGFIYSKINDRDLADDFFQETFIKVINTLKSKMHYDEKGKFIPWVLRIANNLIIDYFRKSQKVKMYRDNDEFSIFNFLKDESPSIESLYFNESVAEDLKTLMNKLPADQQEVLEMRYFQELSFKEISEITNVSLNTSLGRMRYAITNLKKLAKKNNIYLAV